MTVDSKLVAAAVAAAAAAAAYLALRPARKPIKIGYWAIRGLGAPCRMAAEYGSLPYESVEYMVHKTTDGWDRSQWFNEKPSL